MQTVPNSALLFLCWLLKKISFFRSFSLTKICAFSLLWSRTRVCAASSQKNTNFFFGKKCHKTFFGLQTFLHFFSTYINKGMSFGVRYFGKIHVTSSEWQQHVFCIYKNQVFSQPEVKMLLLFLNLSLSRAIIHQDPIL